MIASLASVKALSSEFCIQKKKLHLLISKSNPDELFIVLDAAADGVTERVAVNLVWFGILIYYTMQSLQ